MLTEVAAMRVFRGVVFGLGLLLLQSCGKGASSSGTNAPAADFSLAASSATVSIVAGGSAQVSLTAAAANGFTGTVAVGVTGLPAGVTASPATVTLSAGAPQTVTLSAGAAAVAGTSQVVFTGASGSLSHTAALAVTVTPVQDFSLTVTPAQVTAVAGGAAAQVSVRADGLNGFAGNVAVAIAGLPGGVVASPSTLTLVPGAAQTVTLTAGAAAGAGTSTVTFTATAGAVSHTATAALTVQAATVLHAAPDVTTYHYNTRRDGLNAQETILTPANVNQSTFGKLAVFPADGKVDAQPLFLAGMTMGGTALHNVLYVASEHGSVYALDADTGAQFWKTSVVPGGESPSDDHGCNQISSEIGITSTPVIDRRFGAHGAIFAVGMSRETNGTYHQRLHALDLVTGAELSGSPTEIAATYPGTGSNSHSGVVVFDPAQYAERAALLLLNGKIYLTWTSHCDFSPYTGWVMAYSEATLQQTSVINLTPNGNMGAIWMSGNGPAADATGDIYLLTGNGTFDNTLTNGMPSKGNYGNTMLRLHDGGTLAVADYFAAYNTTDLSNRDLDLGSGGEMLFDAKDAAGTVHHLMSGAGKDSVLYLADRDNMGKFQASTVAPDAALYQKISGQIGAVFSTPAYFNGVLYQGSSGNALKAFPVVNARLAATAASATAATFGFPGTTPSISANGTSNGIVWTLLSSTSGAAVLHAYDPANLANEFYNSGQAAGGRDGFGNGNKFITPVIVNGKVYVGTPSGVAVFGLLPK